MMKKTEKTENTKKTRKRKVYTKEGFRKMQEMRRSLNTPEFYATRDQSYAKTPEFREKMRQIALKHRREDPFEADFEIVELERPNDYAGVLKEEHLSEM